MNGRVVGEVCDAHDFLGLCFCHGPENLEFNPEYLSAKKTVPESIFMPAQ